MRKAARRAGGALFFLLIFIVSASFTLQGPLRGYVEDSVNASLDGYEVSIRGLDLNLFSASADLEGVIIFQKKNPVTPVAEIEEIRAGLRWARLARGALAGDILINKPKFRLGPDRIEYEAADGKPIGEKGFLGALDAAYPFRIDRVRLTGGELEYTEPGEEPVRVRSIFFEADNIRGLDGRATERPLSVSLRGETGKGSFAMKAEADLNAHGGARGFVHLSGVELAVLQPLASRHGIAIRAGVVDASSTFEASGRKKTLIFDSVSLAGADIDRILGAPGRSRQAEWMKGLFVKARKLRIEGSTIGLVNMEAGRGYRVFFDHVDGVADGLGNRLTGPAEAVLSGRFMGSGPAKVTVVFRPGEKGPDFDLAVTILKADMRAMNDMFRAYGDFDVTSGRFSLLSEIKVSGGGVTGHVRPLFSGMKAFDGRTDDEKRLFRQAHEKPAVLPELLDGVGAEASTCQALVNLARNVFLRVVLPEFEQNVDP